MKLNQCIYCCSTIPRMSRCLISEDLLEKFYPVRYDIIKEEKIRIPCLNFNDDNIETYFLFYELMWWPSLYHYKTLLSFKKLKTPDFPPPQHHFHSFEFSISAAQISCRPDTRTSHVSGSKFTSFSRRSCLRLFA